MVIPNIQTFRRGISENLGIRLGCIAGIDFRRRGQSKRIRNLTMVPTLWDHATRHSLFAWTPI